MCALLGLSVALEKAYGTYFFTVLNVLIMLICSAIQLLYAHTRIFWLPISLGGGQLENLVTFPKTPKPHASLRFE